MPHPACGAVRRMLALALTAEEVDLIQGLGTTLVAVLAVAATLLTTHLTMRGQAAREIANVRLEFRFRQLNELYAPLSVKLEKNRLLYKRLREGKPNPDAWHLLDNIAAVRQTPSDLELAKQILGVDSEIADLIETRAGLIEGSLPASFSQFLGHYAVLKLALEGKTAPIPAEFQYYPATLNEDVAGGMERVSAALKAELDSKK